MLFTRRQAAVQTLGAPEAAARDDVQIVDVRTRGEWLGGHVPGARHIPLDQLPGRLGELNRDKPVAFICQSGSRSKLATKLAGQAGFDAINIRGGMLNWERAGLPTSSR